MTDTDPLLLVLQYLAVSFAEEEWTGSGVANAKALFKRLGGRSYQAEFLRKLGQVYYQGAKYDMSVVAYQEAIREDPTTRTIPS